MVGANNTAVVSSIIDHNTANIAVSDGNDTIVVEVKLAFFSVFHYIPPKDYEQEIHDANSIYPYG